MNDLTQDFIETIQAKFQKEKKAIQTRIEELTLQDPFADPDRLVDNAASDKEASEEDGHERVVALLEELNTQVSAIDGALLRIAQGSFGLCSVCGKLIGKDRLSIMPTATMCIDCQNKNA